MNETSETRRLAAILAADVVGWTARLAADEAETLAALRTLRAEVFDPAIADRGGRIVKLMGDGALVEFPSVVAAAAAAKRVQRNLAERDAPLSLRIGVALGDVVVDGEDLYGDGVNLAARLEAEAEPGGILLSRAAAEQIRGQSGLHLDALGPRSLKGIPEPEEVFRLRVEPTQADRAATAPPTMRIGPPLRTVLAAAALLALIAAAAAVWQTLGPSDDDAVAALPSKPSVAVLPFENLSGDPTHDWFADGLAEDLITDLAQLPELFVIGRSSSFAYKGRAEDSRFVGRALGVAYLLEGSVRREGDVVRVNAKLIDASDGESLWADRIEGEVTDVFAFQDQIVAQIAGSLSRELGVAIDAPETSARSSTSAEALEHYWRGRSALLRVDMVTGGLLGSEAHHELSRAHELAPEDPQIMAALGWSHMHAVWGAMYLNMNGNAEAARGLAERSLALKETGLALMLKAAVLFELDRKDDEALAMGRRAISAAPSDVYIIQYMGAMQMRVGDVAGAVATLEAARELDPYGPDGRPGFTLGLAHLLAGRPADAEELLRRATLVDRGHERTHGIAEDLYLIAALLAQGRDDEAEPLLSSHGKRCSPEAPRSDTVYAWCNIFAVRNAMLFSYGFRSDEILAPLVEPLLAAGFPEEPA